MDIMVILQTMIKLFLILVLGYVLRKVNIFDERVNKGISALVVNVTSPLLIISSISSAQGGEKSIVVKLIGIGIMMYALFVVLGKIISRIVPFPKDDRAIYELMLVFSNTAFMGYPVLLSLFDEASIFYTSMLHMAFSFYIYTYGIITLTSNKEGKFKLNLKSLITPGLILSFVAIIIFVFNIQVPQLILETIQSIGSVTSPLSMMMIGSSLAAYSIKDSLLDINSYIFAPFKLLLLPFLTMLVCKAMHIDPYFANIAIVINGMPIASTVLMLATEYNANQQIVTKNIVVTTILSVITIPIVVATMFI